MDSLYRNFDLIIDEYITNDTIIKWISCIEKNNKLVVYIKEYRGLNINKTEVQKDVLYKYREFIDLLTKYKGTIITFVENCCSNANIAWILASSVSLCLENSKYRFSEKTSNGISIIASTLYKNRISKNKMRYLLITGEIVNANKAEDIGLVDSIIKIEELHNILNYIKENISNISYKIPCNNTNESMIVLGELFNKIDINNTEQYGRIEIKSLNIYKIAILYMDDPKTLNSMTLEMANWIKEKVNYLNTIKELIGVILTGGDSHFNIGLNRIIIKELKKNDIFTISYNLYNIFEGYTSIRKLKCPVISIIDGYCIGGGLALALNSDQIWGTKNCKALYNNRSVGVCPALYLSKLLVNYLGLQKTFDLYMTSVNLNSEDLYKYNIITKIGTTKSSLIDECIEYFKQYSNDINNIDSINNSTKLFRPKLDKNILYEETCKIAQCIKFNNAFEKRLKLNNKHISNNLRYYFFSLLLQ